MYYFEDQLMPEANSFKYLGIIIRNTKRLAYTALVRPILECGAVCWDPYTEGQVSDLNRVQKRAAKFADFLV